MWRIISVIGVFLFLSLNLLLADTIKTKVKAVDDEKRTVTCEVDGKDVTYNVSKDAKIYTTGKAKKGKVGPEIIVTLAATTGKDVTVTTDKVDGKDIVTAIKLEDAKKKKGK